MESERLLNTILKHLSEGLIIVDQNARILYFNEPASNLAGISDAEAIGKNILEVFKDLTIETSTFYQVLQTGQPIVDYVQNYKNYVGESITTLTSTLPLFEDDLLIGAFEVYRDTSAIHKLTEQMERMHKRQLNANQSKTLPQREDKAFLGISEPVQALRKSIRKIADSPSPVFIYGETGVGKELVVQMIHKLSVQRSEAPLIAQNCAAIPNNLLESILFGTTVGSFTGAKNTPGLFELANHGILYLDEINSMEIELQAKLLRVLQDQEIRRVGASTTVRVNVRILASTNEDPETLIAKGRLREDLYYRLKVIPIHIPPLRERIEDIPIMTQAFVQEFNHKLSKNILQIDPLLMKALIAMPWRGNVRELKYMLEGMMNFAEGTVLTTMHLPAHHQKPTVVNGCQEHEHYSLNDSINQLEKSMIQDALKSVNYHLTKAAAKLSIPKQTLFNKMKKHNITITKKI